LEYSTTIDDFGLANKSLFKPSSSLLVVFFLIR